MRDCYSTDNPAADGSSGIGFRFVSFFHDFPVPTMTEFRKDSKLLRIPRPGEDPQLLTGQEATWERPLLACKTTTDRGIDSSIHHSSGFDGRALDKRPDLQGKPIAMNWDEQGRLWISETVDYPNELQP